MAEGTKEATHSLSTEIQMLFEAQGTQEVQGEVDAISNKVAAMVKPMQELTKAFEELNDSPLKNLVRTLDNFSIDSVTVDAGSLRTVLENKIATAITKSKIQFIGDKGNEKYPFKIKMGADFWEKNEKNVTEAMAKSFSNFVVDVDKIPPLDNSEILKEFQTKFNEQIVELIKDDEVFSLFKSNTEKGIKEYKYKRKFKLDEAAVNEIMGAIEDQFVEVLSDSKNIELEDIPKLEISSVKLKQAMMKIQESVGDIDSLLGVDPAALKDLPNIEDKLVQFRSSLDNMIREINNLATQLESITFGKVTEEDIRKSIESIQGLKDEVTVQLDEWIKDISLEIKKNLNIRPNLDTFKESITSLNTFFDTVFQSQLDQFKEDVNKVLASLEIKGIDGGEGKDLLKGKKIDITQTIVDIITENLLNQEVPIELDMGSVDEIITQWSTDFNVLLGEDLQGLIDSILSGIGNVLDLAQVQVDETVKNTLKELNSITGSKDSFFKKEDLNKLMDNIKSNIYSYIVSTLSNVNIKNANVSETEFELPKSFDRDIQRIVDRHTKEYMKKVADKYKEIGGGTGKKEMDESVAKLDKQATMLVNATLREVNKTLSNIRTEFLNNSRDLVNSTNNLKKDFYNRTKALVITFVDSVEDALNTVVLAEDTLDKIKKDTIDHIESIVSVDNIKFKDAPNLELDDVLEDIIAKIEQEIRDIVANWKPFTSTAASGGKSQVEKLLDELTVQEEEVIGTHITSNIDSLKQGKEYKFKQYDNAISLARDPSEEMSYPNINDFSGVMGQLKVEFKGKTLDYLNKEHREFLDNLWKQIRKDTGVDDYFDKVGGYSPDKFTEESGRLVADAKLRFLNELRPYIDGIQNFTIDVDPYHKKGVGFTQDGFYAPELHVLNAEALKILEANEFDFDREYQNVYKEAMNELVDIFKQNQGQKHVLTKLARLEGNELNPVRLLVKDMVTEQASKGTYENEGDFKYVVKSASDYIMKKLKFSAKQLGEMAEESVGEDARITRELSQSTVDALKRVSKEGTPSLDISKLNEEIQKIIQDTFLTEIHNIGDSIIDSSSDWTKDLVAALDKNIQKQIENEITNAEIKDNNDANLELEEAYKKALKRISAELESAIELWFPEVKLTDVINGEYLTEVLQKRIDNAIQYHVDEVVDNIVASGPPSQVKDEYTGKEFYVKDYSLNKMHIADSHDEEYDIHRKPEWDREGKWSYAMRDSVMGHDFLIEPVQEVGKIDIRGLVTNISKSIEEVLQNNINQLIEKLRLTDSFDSDSIVSKVDMEKLTNKIDPLIEKAILVRVEQITLSTESKENLKIDLNKPTRKALKEIEKAINDVVKRETSKFTNGGEDGEVIELDLKTKQLQKNVNSLVQKIVNEKAKQVTSYGNELASEIELNKEEFDKLKENIDSIVDSMLISYETAAENFAGDVLSEEEVNNIYTKLVNSFTDSFTVLTDRLLEGIESISTGEFSISSKKLHPKIKKALADSLDVTVSEFTETFPVISGKEAQEVILRKNVELIVNAVNDVINNSVRGAVSSYEDAIKDLDIEPDNSLIDYVYDQLIKLQDSIVARAKRMVRDQFKFLTEEIKEMNIDAKSMGYKPTQAFSREVMKANPALAEQVSSATSVENLARVLDDAVKKGDIRIETASLQGADVTAQELGINGDNIVVDTIDKLTTNASSVIVDGKVVDLKVDEFPVDKIITPINNYLKNGYPFSVDPEITSHISSLLDDITPQHFLSSNVYKNGYNPLDIDKILFKHETEPYEGFFKGITTNMAKYFMVGYMMKLPIKAITEANKVAAELDYHTAKAKQNMLIKDPQMTNVARNLIYDQYKVEGKDVKSKEFKSDVEKEAANLRNIMKTEMPDYLLNIAKAYQQEISDVGRFYSIASRKSKNPYEALTKTREIAKISAAEEDLDTDFAATGLEALSAQWGVPVGELDRYTNMLLKTAMLSNTTVTDLLMAQRDTAAMFKSRLSGIDDEEAFATSMALSSMFVEATGKSGRESGTFWRNVLQRPYVKDSRKFLEEASKMKGFEDLDPYYTDEAGNRVQKDFLTMFSNILETAMKVDDPSAMTVLSEVFPIRTIGGAESITALVDDLKIDLEKSIESLKKIGELDEDATLESVGVKEVIEKYIENILNVTDKDIGEYIAGLQDTTQFAVKGLQTQWQSTVYNIFREFKEENSAAMTYLTRVLKMFEDGANKLSDVLSLFAKVGVGVLGESAFKRVKSKVLEIPQKPTDVQKAMAEKYLQLQASEKVYDLKRKARAEELGKYKQQMAEIEEDMDLLQDKRQQLHSFISDKEGKKKLSDTEKEELSKAVMQRDMYDDQLIKLRNTYNQLEKHISGLNGGLVEAEKSYTDSIELGNFLKGSMGARNVDEIRDSFANYIRNDAIYTEIAPMVMRSKLSHSDEWYTQLHERKSEIEQSLINQQREMFKHFTDIYGETSEEVLEGILGEDFGDSFYALENRLSEDTVKAMRQIGEHMEFDEEYSNMRKSFEKTYGELNGINTELIDLNNERLEVERAIFEAERPVVEGYANIEGMSMPITKPKTTEQKIEGYRSMLPALGIDIDEFEGGLDRLAAMFKDGKLDVDEYDGSLREVATQLGITEDDFESFKVTVKKLNDEIRQGKKEIYDYMTALELASNKSGKIKSKQVIEGTEDKDAVEIEAKGEGSVGKEVAKAGLFASLFKGSTKTGKDVGTASKLAGKFKGMGTDVLAGGKAVAKAGLKGLLLATVVDAVGSVIGGGLERGMTDSERLSLEADKLEGVINQATGWRPKKDDNAVKRGLDTVIGTALGGYTAGRNQLNKWLGGTAPSAKETWNIWKKARKNPDASLQELRTQFKEEYEVGAKRGRANYEKQLEYLNKNPFVDPLTGQLRGKEDPLLQNLPLEDLMEFLDKRMKILNQQLTESDALFTKEKVQLLVNGISNNSKEMRDAVKKHLDKNIIEMTRIVGELREYLPRLVPGSETHTAMQLQIFELENRIAESELQKFETDFSAYDEIMEKYSRESSTIQSKYDIKKYDALLSGINKDSTAIKQIEKKMAEEQVKMITGIQSRLDTLKQQFADKPEQRDKLLIQIQELEADKKRILADIKDKMSEGLSTFNLPSDIKPITYYEAMTRNNTHKNVSVAAGDAIVNVNIDNMYGSDKDIDKLGRVVSDAVAKAQKNFVRQFANDVKAGMGNNYYSWNEY